MNLLANIAVLAINIMISLCFTPFLVGQIGSESYGYFGLANTMIGYASILAVALNSVAGRFITIQYHQNDRENANRYISSVFYANVFFATCILVVGIVCSMNIDRLLNVPTDLVPQVKLLFFSLCLNFILWLLGTVFMVSTFIKNKLYLGSAATAMAALLQVAILYVLFGFFTNEVYWIGIITAFSTLLIVSSNMVFTRKLTPELKINTRDFSFSRIKELVSSGVWNSISRLAIVLSDGLDLLITNLWIGTWYMGQLAITQIIPGMFARLLTAMTAVFQPNLTKYYALGDTKSTVDELKISMRIGGFFANIAFCFICAFGHYFFRLWMPSEDTELLYTLAILSIVSLISSGAVSSLQSVFFITNKLKVNSLFWLIISMFNVGVLVVLLNTTNLGIYAVVAVSKITGAIANFTFVPIYASICLKIPKRTFYPVILQYVMATLMMLGGFFALRAVIPFNETWESLILLAALSCVLGSLINFCLLLGKRERKILTSKLFGKLRKTHDG